MTAAILAGGRGTRISCEGATTPKVLLDIGGKPFLHLLIQSLKESGFDDILLCLCWQSDQVHAAFRNTPGIRFSFEEQPLGTGGAIKNALDRLPSQFFILNGDTYLETDFERVRRAPTMLVAPSITGNVWLESGRVSLYRKDAIEGYWRDLGGLYSADLFSNTPTTFDMELVINRAIAHGLYRHFVFNPFYEVGSKAGLIETRRAFSGLF